MAGSVAARVRSTVERFLQTLPLPLDALLLVAVSGGQDSACLLDALAASRPGFGLRLAVVHVDHGLREAASEADADAVEGLAGRYALEALTVRVPVERYAKQHKLGLEEAGRLLRYRALGAETGRRSAWAAATGHTADDLAETLLINIIRGSGPRGLTGMPAVQHYTSRFLSLPDSHSRPGGAPRSDLRVIRPLLEVSRQDTEAYCREVGIEFRCDASNLDPTFFRNRVRHHLLPLLRTFNPSISTSLGRLARLLADDELELERLVASAWPEQAVRDGEALIFDWAGWLSQSPALQRRLLRRARAELSGGADWSFQALESARLLLAERPARRALDLGGGVRLTTSRQGFRLVTGGVSS